jgi:hypothetical protein
VPLSRMNTSSLIPQSPRRGAGGAGQRGVAAAWHGDRVSPTPERLS